ncbi:hypothetical protein T484DRAFT_1894297 [Baffinella frigidus]|nr:hypothetical protein T484DRAFT_1894297 [Cryptophyta sp. CCMP2293]
MFAGSFATVAACLRDRSRLQMDFGARLEAMKAGILTKKGQLTPQALTVLDKEAEASRKRRRAGPPSLIPPPLPAPAPGLSDLLSLEAGRNATGRAEGGEGVEGGDEGDGEEEEGGARKRRRTAGGDSSAVTQAKSGRTAGEVGDGEGAVGTGLNATSGAVWNATSGAVVDKLEVPEWAWGGLNDIAASDLISDVSDDDEGGEDDWGDDATGKPREVTGKTRGENDDGDSVLPSDSNEGGEDGWEGAGGFDEDEDGEEEEEEDSVKDLERPGLRGRLAPAMLLGPSKKLRANKAERMQSIKDGRKAKPFGDRPMRSNLDKLRTKPFPMVQAKLRRNALKQADTHVKKSIERKRHRGHFKKVKRKKGGT